MLYKKKKRESMEDSNVLEMNAVIRDAPNKKNGIIWEFFPPFENFNLFFTEIF